MKAVKSKDLTALVYESEGIEMSYTFRTQTARLFKYENDEFIELVISIKPVITEKPDVYVAEFSLIETSETNTYTNHKIETRRYEWDILECKSFKPMFERLRFEARWEAYYNCFMYEEMPCEYKLKYNKEKGRVLNIRHILQNDKLVADKWSKLSLDEKKQAFHNALDY